MLIKSSPDSMSSWAKHFLSEQLNGKTLKKPSVWVEKCRVMKDGPYDPQLTPWTKDMHNSTDEHWCSMKGAQVGISEVLINTAFHALDQLDISVLYALPTFDPGATDFSNTRFNPAVDLSPYLQNVFSDIQNIRLKQAGNNFLYVRGSNGKDAFRSIPVGMVILDEVDAMSKAAVAQARERMSGQEIKLFREASTPTVEDYGIHSTFKLSTQDHFIFKCPHCNRHIEFKFPDSLIITAEVATDPKVKDSYYVCTECKATLNHKEKRNFLATGKWQKSYVDRNIRGFYINQMYSSRVTPAEFALNYLDSLADPAKEQEFYNSKLGLAHIVEGAKVTDKEIETALRHYRNGETPPIGYFTVGIDVGKVLHVVVKKWMTPPRCRDITVESKSQVVYFGKVEDMSAGFPSLDKIIKYWKPRGVVIDAMPERRSSDAFAKRWNGLVTVCFYNDNVPSRDLKLDPTEARVTVNRTVWLDTTFGRYKNGSVVLPMDTSYEYKEHLKAQTRKYERGKNNAVTVSYVGNAADHFAHAENYSEIALAISATLGVNKNIGSPI